MNVRVQRVLDRYGIELDAADAVAFAETIVDSWKRVVNYSGASVPSKRELNLALAFLQMKFPCQCCQAKQICDDCQMRTWDVNLKGKK